MTSCKWLKYGEFTLESPTEKIRFRLITFETIIVLCCSDQKYLSASATIQNVSKFMVHTLGFDSPELDKHESPCNPC